jgi:DNA relaxase NicK
MVNLLLEEQTNNIIYGELLHFKDFEDWIRCVSGEEEKRNEIFVGKLAIKLLHIFQLGLEKQGKKTNCFYQCFCKKGQYMG